jgi:cell division protein FtsW
LFIISIIGVVMSLVGGAEIKGATRWIRVFGFSVQPSEFLKPGFIIVSAWLLSMQKTNSDRPYILSSIMLYGLSACLLILQPDFGMVFLITCVFAIQIFLIGCPLRYIAMLGGLFIIGIVTAYFTLGHVQSRIDRFLDPAGTDTYQIDQSKQAFMNGSIIGQGPGQGEVKNAVPDIHSDFIFTAIGEEWGFVFTALFVIVLVYLFYRLLMRFARSDSQFVMLAGGGLVFMLAVQSFIHMGSTIELIPAKGMTLPFISYGGSSLVAVGISFGLILALSRHIPDNQKRSNWRHLKNLKS